MNPATRVASFASIVALLLGAVAMGDAPATARTAPTPYPSRAEDWPGTGVVRIFGWMTENRNYFWTEREKKQGSIVFAGDSLTASWSTLSQDFPGARIANRGIGGDVSRGLLFRFKEDVLDLDPKAIVILIGINDLTARQPASATLANLRSMLEMEQRLRPGVPVVLCTVPPSANPKAPVDEQQRRELNQGLRQLAKETRNASLVDLYAATVTSDGVPDTKYFKPDLLHLSAEGHARWKEVLQPALRAAGVL